MDGVCQVFVDVHIVLMRDDDASVSLLVVRWMADPSPHQSELQMFDLTVRREEDFSPNGAAVNSQGRKPLDNSKTEWS